MDRLKSWRSDKLLVKYILLMVEHEKGQDRAKKLFSPLHNAHMLISLVYYDKASTVGNTLTQHLYREMHQRCCS